MSAAKDVESGGGRGRGRRRNRKEKDKIPGNVCQNRLNEERAEALERSARQSEQTLAKTEANLKEAAEAQAKFERSRDRAMKVRRSTHEIT